MYLERDGDKKMYFILETKGTTDLFGLRTPEQLKIHCGTEHFKALENGGADMYVAKNWSKFKVEH